MAKQTATSVAKDNPYKDQNDPDAHQFLRNQGLVALLAVCTLVLFVLYQSTYIVLGGIILCVGASRWLQTGGQLKFPVQDRAVLITGCDTGFGHHVAKQLSVLGVTVFAGCLHSFGDGAKALKALRQRNLHVLQMDITNDKDIQEVLKFVKQTIGDTGLWGVVNNAGINYFTDIELYTKEQIEMMINVNQLGMVQVTRTFLPLIRASKGRVVNVTSCQGRLPIIYNGIYGMTKFACEAFSDILRMEMSKFGVRVVIIEPGNFGSVTACAEPDRIQRGLENMWQKMSPELKKTYGKEYVFHHSTRIQESLHTSSTDISLVTNTMVDALFLVQPKSRYLIGGSNHWYDKDILLARLYPFLPSWYLDGLMVHSVRGSPTPDALLNEEHTH